MLDGCHGAKTDHISWAPGQHQPIGAQYGSILTNHSAAQGPAAGTRDGFVTVDEDWHRGLWHGSYLSLAICPSEAWAGAGWPIRGLLMANKSPGLLRGSDQSGFHQTHSSPSHPLHEQHITRSRIVREPIHHTLTSNISSIRRGSEELD